MVTAQLGVYIGAPLFLYNEKKTKHAWQPNAKFAPDVPFTSKHTDKS